jgi:nitrile hydratase
VLEEFGVHIGKEIAVTVWDSSADIRYLVLPERPIGTETWTEEQLVAIVTRDCMIGVALPQVPASARR